MNGSENSEITNGNGGGNVNGEVPILQGDGRVPTLSDERDNVSGSTEVSQEPSQENAQIQAPKSRRGQISPEEREKTLKLMVEDSLKNGLAAYNGFEIKKLYPKTYEKIAEYMGMKAQMPGLMDEETVIGILLYSPRIVLFDFFDINKIYVNTDINLDMWIYKINKPNYSHSSKAYSSRLNAEIDGFYEAFKLFEEQLTNI